jgi:hypothetical protein
LTPNGCKPSTNIAPKSRVMILRSGNYPVAILNADASPVGRKVVLIAERYYGERKFMALRIKTEERNGVETINPDTLRALAMFQKHQKSCSNCSGFSNGKGENYCAVGEMMMAEIRARPDVEFVP